MKPSPSLKYKLADTYSEHEKSPIYCVSFNLLDPAQSHLFVSCGGRRVSVTRVFIS